MLRLQMQTALITLRLRLRIAVGVRQICSWQSIAILPAERHLVILHLKFVSVVIIPTVIYVDFVIMVLEIGTHVNGIVRALSPMTAKLIPDAPLGLGRVAVLTPETKGVFRKRTVGQINADVDADQVAPVMQ